MRTSRQAVNEPGNSGAAVCAGLTGSVSMHPVHTVVLWRPVEETLCGEENKEAALSALRLHAPCPQRLLPLGRITGTEDQE